MPVKCITVGEALVGMTLARPVVDENGRTLCGEKTVLTEKLIAQFVRNNINGLYVQNEEKISAQEYELQKSLIITRFQNIPPNSILNDLKQILLEKLEDRK